MLVDVVNKDIYDTSQSTGLFLSYISTKPRVINHSNLKCLYFLRKQTSHDEEAVVQMCFVKKVFLEISQNSQENTCARISFLIKLCASGLQLY